MSTQFTVSTDLKNMDLNFIYNYLSRESYWASGRSLERVTKSMANSMCFGLFDGQKQIGFGRVATDYVVFAWLMDVFIDPGYRGRGLGRFLISSILEHPDLQEVNGMGLRTEDAHDLYNGFGFGPIPDPNSWMFKKCRI